MKSPRLIYDFEFCSKNYSWFPWTVTTSGIVIGTIISPPYLWESITSAVLLFSSYRSSISSLFVTFSSLFWYVPDRLISASIWEDFLSRSPSFVPVCIGVLSRSCVERPLSITFSFTATTVVLDTGLFLFFDTEDLRIVYSNLLKMGYLAIADLLARLASTTFASSCFKVVEDWMIPLASWLFEGDFEADPYWFARESSCFFAYYPTFDFFDFKEFWVTPDFYPNDFPVAFW